MIDDFAGGHFYEHFDDTGKNGAIHADIIYADTREMLERYVAEAGARMNVRYVDPDRPAIGIGEARVEVPRVGTATPPP